MMFLISIEQQIECVERELKYRERVYARRVAEKKMTQALADRELLRMRAVLSTLHLVRHHQPSVSVTVP